VSYRRRFCVTGSNYSGAWGQRYRFRVTAVDQVSNTASAQQDVFVPPAVTRYYLHGSARLAMRVVSGTESVVYYLHGDHLSSVSLTTDDSGAVVARQLWRAWGAARWVSGVNFRPGLVQRFSAKMVHSQRWHNGNSSA